MAAMSAPVSTAATPGLALGPGLVDADDARVGMGTSEHRHVQQPRRLQVTRTCNARPVTFWKASRRSTDVPTME